ncbi:MAG: hypothetical protein CBC35_02635 [Planctomycetes bacterium TMED75]|nr:hypothetical protein [Planctomycetaceae bacterium]OUU95545.1 MAG: hypothetical protein CBC35_02635 [Planctomycetes bacterium TMED75]
MTQDPTASNDSDSLSERVRDVLEMMRPMIQEDDGDVELVDVSPEGVVRIRFMGACVNCPSSANTLHNGIERMLKQRVPEVTGVEATDPNEKTKKS